MTNTALSMELPSYLPYSASTYAIAATLATGSYYASHWYTNPYPLDITLDSINALTCIPIKNTNKDNNAIPWYTLVEMMQQNKMAQKSIMQVQSHHNTVIEVEKGISAQPEHETLFLFSRGYAARGSLMPGTPLANKYRDVVNIGGGLMSAHIAIKDHLVTNAPCYSFDYPDTVRYLNLAQTKDLECLKTVWGEIARKNPHAKIVGIGDCRGSKALLEFATEKPKNLKALVLLAPFVSVEELAHHIAHNYLPFPYSDKILHLLMKYGLPSVDSAQDDLAERLPLINKKLPIFIAHRTGDAVISYKDIQLLTNVLQKSGNQDVYLLEIKDDSASHSNLSHIPELQQALNAFYAQYSLPHNKTLAQEGKELLKEAKTAAQSIVTGNQ